MKKQDKSKVVENLSKNFKEAKSISLIDFTGMDILAQQELKRNLKKVTAKMIVAKNTLIKIAINEAKLPKELTEGETLSGQTAVVFGEEDPVSPVQAIGKFASTNEFLEFKAGVIEGEYQDKNSMILVSKLPSKDVLVGQVVGSVAGPMYSLISNLQASVQELLGTLSAKVG